MNQPIDLRQFYNPKLTPATLTAYLDDKWIPAPHLMYVSAKVATAVQKGGGRLIISLPPRHGKSRMLSIGGTTWVLENYADRNVGLCTYGADLSVDFSGAVRTQIELNSQKLDCRIATGFNRVDRFKTERNSWVFAFGLKGAIIGRGFHVFFLDDFIKNLKEATSATYRQEVWDWFITTAITRLEPGSTVVIIATRWHLDDLIGRLIREDPHTWEYVRIPAIAEDDDPIGRRPGEALFPQRYDLEHLDKIRRLMGSFWWSAIYQQDPRGDTAKLANKEWLQYLNSEALPNPNHLSWGRFWDFAGKKKGGDYTVGLLFGADKPRKTGYIYDVKREQLSPNELDNLVKTTAESDGKGVPVYILEEPGASGLITTEHFKKLLKGFTTVHGVPEVINKVAKAHSMLAGAERGDLYLKMAHWNETFADEFDRFGHECDYDDQVDCAAVGWNKLIGIIEMGTTWGRTPVSDDPNVRGSVPSDPRQVGTSKGVTWGRSSSGNLIVPVGTRRI
jgi:predicted phage terminase large subunit-like protein